MGSFIHVVVAAGLGSLNTSGLGHTCTMSCLVEIGVCCGRSWSSGGSTLFLWIWFTSCKVAFTNYQRSPIPAELSGVIRLGRWLLLSIVDSATEASLRSHASGSGDGGGAWRRYQLGCWVRRRRGSRRQAVERLGERRRLRAWSGPMRGKPVGFVKFVVEALRGLDWTWKTGGRLDRLHIRVHLWWVSRWVRRMLVVAGARCPLTQPGVAAVEVQATTEPHCSRGVQPGGTSRAGPRRSGVGLAPRPQALPMPAAALPLCFYV
jgi:hypothetical protein